MSGSGSRARRPGRSRTSGSRGRHPVPRRCSHDRICGVWSPSRGCSPRKSRPPRGSWPHLSSPRHPQSRRARITFRTVRHISRPSMEELAISLLNPVERYSITRKQAHQASTCSWVTQRCSWGGGSSRWSEESLRGCKYFIHLGPWFPRVRQVRVRGDGL